MLFFFSGPQFDLNLKWYNQTVISQPLTGGWPLTLWPPPSLLTQYDIHINNVRLVSHHMLLIHVVCSCAWNEGQELGLLSSFESVWLGGSRLYSRVFCFKMKLFSSQLTNRLICSWMFSNVINKERNFGYTLNCFQEWKQEFGILPLNLSGFGQQNWF